MKSFQYKNKFLSKLSWFKNHRSSQSNTAAEREQTVRKRAEQLETERECRTLAPQLFGQDAKILQTRQDLLFYAVEYTRTRGLDGLWMEFGVHKAESLHLIADAISGTVYGFDSFSGLPEDWSVGIGRVARKGQFAVSPLPEVRENARLVVGLFEDSLPGFVATHPESVAFAHIDCDLYSSTKTVLDLLKLQPGSILVFDEYYNYPNWREGEFKAFQEFLNEQHVEVTCLAYAVQGWNAAFQVTNVNAAKTA